MHSKNSIVINNKKQYGVKTDFSFEELESSNLTLPYTYKYIVGICEGVYHQSTNETQPYSDIEIYKVDGQRFNSLSQGNWIYEFTTTSGLFMSKSINGNWLLVNKWYKEKCKHSKEFLTIDSVIKVLREFEALPIDDVDTDLLKEENLALKQKVKELKAAIKVAKNAFKTL